MEDRKSKKDMENKTATAETTNTTETDTSDITDRRVTGFKGPEDTSIQIENEQSAAAFDGKLAELVENTALECIREENLKIGCSVSVTISDNASIRAINRQFRNVDSSTDVLSFPLADFKNGVLLSDDGDYDMDEGLLLLGDIVISLETAQRQAAQYGHKLERELSFLVSHGMFHLMGYDHMSGDEEAAKQEKVLGKLGLEKK